MQVIDSKGCQCSECQQAFTGTLQESLLHIDRFSSLNCLVLGAGKVHDISALARQTSLEHLTLPITPRELQGLDGVLSSNPLLFELELKSLPCPLSSQSITNLSFVFLDISTFENLFSSQLPSLKELRVEHLYLDDPYFSGYERLRNFAPIVKILFLMNDQKLPAPLTACSS